MKNEELMERHSRWSSVVMISIIALVALICIIDIIFKLGLTKNMYLFTFMLAGTVIAILSIVWISIMNRQHKTETAPLQPAVVAPEEKVMTLSDVEYCIRKEGYIPVRKENSVCFKISGEEIEIFYEDEKMSIIRSYGLDQDVNLEILLKACSMLHDSTFLIRSSVHRYDNNQLGLVFEIQSLIVSPTELERFFEKYLNVLYYGIQRHREIYGKLLEELESTVEEQPTTQQRQHKVLS